MTGQPITALLDAPPHVVRALRTAWTLMQAEDEARQRQARHGR